MEPDASAWRLMFSDKALHFPVVANRNRVVASRDHEAFRTHEATTMFKATPRPVRNVGMVQKWPFGVTS